MDRWARAIKDKSFDSIRALPLLETQAALFYRTKGSRLISSFHAVCALSLFIFVRPALCAFAGFAQRIGGRFRAGCTRRQRF